MLVVTLKEGGGIEVLHGTETLTITIDSLSSSKTKLTVSGPRSFKVSRFKGDHDDHRQTEGCEKPRTR